MGKLDRPIGKSLPYSMPTKKITKGGNMIGEDKRELMPSEKGVCENPTVKEKLEKRKMIIEDELREIDKTLRIMETHPEVMTVIDSFRKLGHLHC